MATQIAADMDWSDVKPRTTNRLAAPKVTPVPPSIIKLAQESYDGRKMSDGTVGHILEHEFDTPERAAAFAKHMKNAGPHVKTNEGVGGSVSVVIDPDKTGNAKLVSWKSGGRRGRKPAGGTTPAAA